MPLEVAAVISLRSDIRELLKYYHDDHARITYLFCWWKLSAESNEYSYPWIPSKILADILLGINSKDALPPIISYILDIRADRYQEYQNGSLVNLAEWFNTSFRSEYQPIYFSLPFHVSPCLKRIYVLGNILNSLTANVNESEGLHLISCSYKHFLAGASTQCYSTKLAALKPAIYSDEHCRLLSGYTEGFDLGLEGYCASLSYCLVSPFALPSFLSSVCEGREDLLSMAASSFLPTSRVLDWWTSTGYREYPMHSWPFIHNYLRYLREYGIIAQYRYSKITRSLYSLNLESREDNGHNHKSFYCNVVSDLFMPGYLYMIFNSNYRLRSFVSIGSTITDERISYFRLVLWLAWYGRRDYKVDFDKCYMYYQYCIAKQLLSSDEERIISSAMSGKRVHLDNSLYTNIPLDQSILSPRLIPAFLEEIVSERTDLSSYIRGLEIADARAFLVNWWMTSGLYEYPDQEWSFIQPYIWMLIITRSLVVTETSKSSACELISQLCRMPFYPDDILPAITYLRSYVISSVSIGDQSIASLWAHLFNEVSNQAALVPECLHYNLSSLLSLVADDQRADQSFNLYLNRATPPALEEVTRPSSGTYEQTSTHTEIQLHYDKAADLPDYLGQDHYNNDSLVHQFGESPLHIRSKPSSTRQNQHFVSLPSTAKKVDVCVLGFHEYQLGIGEDARLAYYALARDETIGVVKACRVPLTTTNSFKPCGFPVHDYFDSRIVIIVLPPPEIVSLYMKDVRWFLAQSVIAICPWELPTIPTSVTRILDKLTAIIAPSRYIANALSSSAAPVHVIGHSISPPCIPSIAKAPKFTFLYSADVNSFLSRKNPECCIISFITFIRRCSLAGKIQLIVRLTNYKRRINASLDSLLDSSHDVVLLTDNLDDQAYSRLIASSHCYVSPHRSEGFGRNIAEAMYHGVPVIASNYSGNLDFCSHTNSYLIDGRLVPVTPGAYPFSDDQFWFEPSHDHLSHLMEDVFTKYSHALKKAAYAKDLIRSSFGFDSYQKELSQFISRFNAPLHENASPLFS